MALVWMALALAAGLSTLYLLLQNRQGCFPADPLRDGFETIIQIYRLLTGQGIRDPKCWSRRMVLGLWMLFAVTLSASYSGNLVSFMTNPGLEDAIDTVKKLVRSVKDNHFTCGTIKDAAEYAMLKNDNSSEAKILLKSMESNPRNFVQRDGEGLRNCLTRNYAYLGGEITINADMSDERLFVFAKDSFQTGCYSLAFHRDFPCLRQFNSRILRLQGSGIISLWLEHEIFRARKWHYNADRGSRPLKVSYVEGPFLLLAAGLAVASIIVVCEILIAKRASPCCNK
ncbi:glutamate receptor ionotropic, kainate 3-like [Ornithodoros turicata]|uniref:glutamate receptor ionotropic, kainate 3-like n=1 Tax=Ornithodoros turicata TaxID=34597 RepID=UPI003138B2ED